MLHRCFNRTVLTCQQSNAQAHISKSCADHFSSIIARDPSTLAQSSQLSQPNTSLDACTLTAEEVNYSLSRSLEGSRCQETRTFSVAKKPAEVLTQRNLSGQAESVWKSTQVVSAVSSTSTCQVTPAFPSSRILTRAIVPFVRASAREGVAALGSGSHFISKIPTKASKY